MRFIVKFTLSTVQVQRSYLKQTLLLHSFSNEINFKLNFNIFKLTQARGNSTIKGQKHKQEAKVQARGKVHAKGKSNRQKYKQEAKAQLRAKTQARGKSTSKRQKYKQEAITQAQSRMN